MLPLSISAYHGLPYRVLTQGAITYYVHLGCGLDNLGFDEISFLFDNAWRREHATSINTKGGRGQTVLFDLPLSALKDPSLTAVPVADTSLASTPALANTKEQAFLREAVADATWPEPQETVHWCYRLYLRGGMVGKVISNKFCRFASTAHRARDEFLMLLKMRLLGLPVPRPIVAKETMGLCMMSNEIIIEQLRNTENLFEVMSQREMTQDEGLKLGRTLGSFFQYNIHHTDLNLRNILLDSKGDFYLIDFDKCRFKENVYTSPILVTRMLDRLQRSFVKATRQNIGFHYQEEWAEVVRHETFATLISTTQDNSPFIGNLPGQTPLVTDILANLIIGQNWNITEAQVQFAKDPQLKAHLIEAEQRWLADKASSHESPAQKASESAEYAEYAESAENAEKAEAVDANVAAENYSQSPTTAQAMAMAKDEAKAEPASDAATNVETKSKP